jgi:YVTN family beta-propeller protein
MRRRPRALTLSLGLLAGCPDAAPSDDESASSSSTDDGGTTTTPAETTTLDGTTALADTSTTAAPDDTSATETTGEPPLPARLGVTADWKGRTLSVFDLDALAGGATTREEVVVRTIDLADYAPGPLELEVAPDGHTVLVSISPGFFGGFVGNLFGAGEVEQEGALLVVDLETGSVTELVTAHVPMGFAIAPDGSLAYSANFGTDDVNGSTMSIIDLATLTVIEEIEVGGRPEQVSLNFDGTLGILNTDTLNGVRVFETSDPAGTLSATLEVGEDPSDVDFVPGTDYAVVANSIDPTNFVVIDVSDPSMPTEVVVGPPPLGAAYAITPIPGAPDVLYNASDFASVFLQRISIDPNGTPTIEWETTTPGNTFPLGVAVDPVAGLALTALPGVNALSVQDLAGGEPRLVPWQDDIGPTYVAIAPAR